MATILLEENNSLVQNEDGIWVLPTGGGFDYTDGEASENFLRYVVTHAKDVTSQSLELEKTPKVADIIDIVADAMG